MKSFFEKLDQIAGKMVETMDSELQQPVVRAMTGEVFVHGAAEHNGQPKAQPVAPVAKPAHTPDYCPTCPPTLRQAGALD